VLVVVLQELTTCRVLTRLHGCKVSIIRHHLGDLKEVSVERPLFAIDLLGAWTLDCYQYHFAGKVNKILLSVCKCSGKIWLCKAWHLFRGAVN